MFYPYNNINTESRNGWKNAYEIQAEAIEYEKLRHYIGAENSPVKQQQRSGWKAISKAPQLLVSFLFK